MDFEFDFKETAKNFAKRAAKGALKIGKAGAKLAGKAAVGLSKTIKAVKEEIKNDVEAVKQRDPAAKNGVEILRK